MDDVYSFSTSEGIEELLKEFTGNTSSSVSAEDSSSSEATTTRKQAIEKFRDRLSKMRKTKTRTARGGKQMSNTLFSLKNHVQSVNDQFQAKLKESSMQDMLVWKSNCLENKLKWKAQLNNLSDDDDDVDDVRAEYNQWKTQLAFVKNKIKELGDESVPMIDVDLD